MNLDHVTECDCTHYTVDWRCVSDHPGQCDRCDRYVSTRILMLVSVDGCREEQRWCVACSADRIAA